MTHGPSGDMRVVTFGKFAIALCAFVLGAVLVWLNVKSLLEAEETAVMRGVDALANGSDFDIEGWSAHWKMFHGAFALSGLLLLIGGSLLFRKSSLGLLAIGLALFIGASVQPVLIFLDMTPFLFWEVSAAENIVLALFGAIFVVIWVRGARGQV